MTQLTIEQVRSVYSGKNGSCCCGCSGKHYYPSNLIEEASKYRGYKVTLDEVNDKMIRKVIQIINDALVLQSAPNHPKVDISKNYISTVVGKRLYIAYLKN